MLLMAFLAMASTVSVATIGLVLGFSSGGSLADATAFSGLRFVALHALQAFGYLMFIGYTLLAEPLLRSTADRRRT